MSGRGTDHRSSKFQLQQAIHAMRESDRDGRNIDLEQLIDEFRLTDEVAIVELIYAQINLKRGRGAPVDPEFYLKRFPQYASQLGKLLEVDQVMNQKSETMPYLLIQFRSRIGRP